MIKVILWDIDGTLLDFLSGEKASVQEAFQLLNLGVCTDEMARRYSAINLSYWEKLERGEVTKPELLIRRFQDFLATCALDTSLAQTLCDTYETCLGEAVYFFPYATQTLQALKGKVVQCAVTNGTKSVQDRKLEKSGIASLLDYIFISETVGYEKPRKEFFDVVFKTIGSYAPDEVLIVGDSLTSDMLGGATYGLKTCLFDPFQKKPSTDIHIDYRIQDLREVLNLL